MSLLTKHGKRIFPVSNQTCSSPFYWSLPQANINYQLVTLKSTGESLCSFSRRNSKRHLLFIKMINMEIDISKRVSSVSEREEVLPGGCLDKWRWKGRKRHERESIAKNLTWILEFYFDLIYFIFILYHGFNILTLQPAFAFLSVRFFTIAYMPYITHILTVHQQAFVVQRSG